MPHPVTAVANTLLDHGEAAGFAFDPMQIQKLMYYAHGWHLGLTGQPLIDEFFEAWTHGPVVQSLYHEFKRFGARRIHGRARAFDPATGRFYHPGIDPRVDGFAVDLLQRIVEEYGAYTGIQLSSMTHRDDGPWARTRDRFPWSRSAPIDNDLIRTYFEQQANRQAFRNHPEAPVAGPG